MATLHPAGQFFAEDNQRILITEALPAAASWRGAVAFAPDVGEAWVEFGGTVAFQTNGLSFSAAGALCVVDASAGLPAGTVWANGLPFAAGRLCVDDSGDIFNVQNGVPFTEVGAVAVSGSTGDESIVTEDDDPITTEDDEILVTE